MSRLVLVSLLLALAVGCKGDSTSPIPVGRVKIATVAEPLMQLVPMALSVSVTSSSGEALDQGRVQWTSLDTKLATVDSTGVVTPLKAGRVRIVASAGNVADGIDLTIHVRWLDLALARDAEGACAIAADSLAYCWGTQFGSDDASGPPTRPVEVPGGFHFRSIALHSRHGCGVVASGRVYCWGANDWGQLGDGTRTASRTPVAVIGLPDASRVMAAVSYACAITRTDLVYCWGHDDFGQIGDGQSATLLVQPPTRVNGLPRPSRLTLAGLHACALGTDGAAHCWGYTGWGLLGAESTDYVATPLRAGGSLLFRDIYASLYLSCGVATTGGVYCWGLYAGASPTPQLEPGTDAFTAIAISSTVVHKCALGPTGVSCWGSAYSLGLGDVTTTIAFPTPIPGTESLVRLEASQGATCGLSRTGAAYCWGANPEGTLGNGTKQASAVPVLVLDPAS